jgi:hypothetical protein
LAEITAAYQNHTKTEIPGLDGRLKAITSEPTENEKRPQNLMTRPSDLPPELSADPIYERLEDLNAAKPKLTASRQKLDSEQRLLQAQSVDTDAFQVRLKAALAILRTAPEEKRRPIYASVFKFAEIHPTRVKLGIYAPAKTNTRDSHPLRGAYSAGSTTVLFGARGGTRTPTSCDTGS